MASTVKTQNFRVKPLPGIPRPSVNLPPAINEIIEPLKENVEILNGTLGWQGQAVTLSMLVNLQVITEAQARSVARGE